MKSNTKDNNKFFTLRATIGIAALTICATANAQHVSNLTLSTDAVTGGSLNKVYGTVYLEKPAGKGGATVVLKSDSDLVGVPSKVRVEGGDISAEFELDTTTRVDENSVVTIAASGGKDVFAKLTIKAMRVIHLTVPKPILPGTIAQGSLDLGSPGTLKDQKVILKSTNPNVRVPETIVVSGGSTAATFDIDTTAISGSETGVIVAIVGVNEKSTNVTVKATSVSKLKFAASSSFGDSEVSGVVTLNQPAPKGGVEVKVVADNEIVSGLDKTIFIEEGQIEAKFTCWVKGVSETTIVTFEAVTGKSAVKKALKVKANKS